MQQGMRAALSCQKLVPLIEEVTKDGKKETRQLVLKGDFYIFIDGQPKPMKLPAKLEFKDNPGVVGLIQQALNIAGTGERCLLTVHSNKQERLEKFDDWLKGKSKQQELEFGPKEDKETDLEHEEEE